MYWWIKNLHQLTACLSIMGFVLRAFWMARGSPLLRHRLTRILPHINDSVLLLAGLWLAVTLGIDPRNHGWLAAKLGGLVIYIVLGSVALRHGRSRRMRICAAVAAASVFAWMVSVAHMKTPLGLFSLLAG